MDYPKQVISTRVNKALDIEAWTCAQFEFIVKSGDGWAEVYLDSAAVRKVNQYVLDGVDFMFEGFSDARVYEDGIHLTSNRLATIEDVSQHLAMVRVAAAVAMRFEKLR